MVKAINPGAITRYVLSRERSLPIEEQSVFLLKTLTVREMESVEGRGIEVDPETKMMRVKGAAQARTALSFGLAGWENFDAEFRLDGRGRVTDDAISRIPAWARDELGDVITSQSQLDDEQVGNSD